MKRNTYILALVCCVAAISMGFLSCKGVDWDTEASLRGMSNNWAYQYVGRVINKYNDFKFTPDSTDSKHAIVTINDTIAVESVYTGMIDGDSVNVTTTVVMVDSTMIVTANGYRFANNLTAHIFTLDSGIINCNGILHIDFYQTDGMIPWAWTEVAFFNDNQHQTYYFNNTKFGWY